MSLPRARANGAAEASAPLSPPLPEHPTGDELASAPTPTARDGNAAREAPRTRRARAAGTADASAEGEKGAYALWPVNKVEGAAGRLVRIGTFQSEADARDGWSKILGEYPGMRRLDMTLVSGKSLRDGQTFYRVQVGTSSHAHSEVLCQRARSLSLSCSVIGLIVADHE
jgi:hypothetical protein